MTIEGTTGERPRSGVEISPQAAEARKAVMEKLKQKRDDMIDEVKKEFEERFSKGGNQTTEMAKNRYYEIRNRQMEEIKNTYDGLIARFEQTIARDSSVDMEKLAEELLESADNTAKQRLEKLKTVLSKKVEGEYMNTNEIAAIDKAVKAIEQLEKKHPNLHALFIKIGEGGNLTEEEYGRVIDLIHPADFAKIQASGSETFEATAAGLLIGMMNPSQRFDLIKNFMESDKKEMTIGLIDVFLKTGVINLMQGGELFNLAVEKGVISREKFEAEYKAKIEGAYYTEEFKKFREAVGSETMRDIGGRYSRNVVDRFVGKPMLHSMLLLWGGATVLINVLASRKKGDFAQTLKNIAKNEYIWIGAGAAGVGYEGATGTMREGRGKEGLLGFLGLGSGNISVWLDKILSDEDRENTTKRNAVKTLAENYLGAPADFREFLEKGGHSTIIKFKNQKDASGAPVMNLQKVIESEPDAGRKASLQKLTPLNAPPERKIDKLLFGVAISAEALGMDEGKENLTDWLKKIRETQIST